MTPDWHLTIARARAGGHPEPGTAAWKEVTGGPEHLLRWLEEQLALRVPPTPQPIRIARYGEALERALGVAVGGAPGGDAGGDGRAVCRESFETDPWATAAELLSRRDELRLAGWDGGAGEGLPPLVRDLARAEEGFDAPGVPDRLARVEAALDRGQTLPPHRVILEEAPDRWPPAWRSVLGRLRTEAASEPDPAAATGGSGHGGSDHGDSGQGGPGPVASGLRRLQERLAGRADGAAPRDDSLTWLSAGGVHQAAQLLAAGLAADEADPERTVVYAPDPGHAAQLEEALVRLGLPAVGAPRPLTGHPAHQVLPLAVELCWEPVDPSILMDLLSLALGPMPGRVARELAQALGEFPGLGSRSWEEAWAKLEEERPEEVERASPWLLHERVGLGEPLPAELVAERCALVARWARGRAEAMERDDGAEGPAGPENGAEAGAGARTEEPGGGAEGRAAEVLRGVQAQAAALRELVEGRSGPVTKPQLLRVLEDVRRTGGAFEARPAQVGAPLLVESLADVPDWCRRLVWLGTGMEERPGRRWSRGELAALQAAGIEVDDGERDLAERREAERRGLLRVSESILAVTVPADDELRPHPLWSRVKSALAPDEGEDRAHPVPAMDRVRDAARVGPWRLAAEEVPVEPAPEPRPHWPIPPEVLTPPERSSPTELETRLACPLRWVLERVAGIRPGRWASLPNDFLLRGRFAHAVLEDVFGEEGGLTDPDEAERAVTARFDERLPLDAVPLALPHRMAERQRFRRHLARSARVLAEALGKGGYRVEAMEAEVEGRLEGRPLRGRVDLVAANEEGEAIIDFKYLGSAGGRYRDLLAQGQAAQLACYAAARAGGRGAQAEGEDGAEEGDAVGEGDAAGDGGGARGTLPAVAYLVLNEARLLTPEGSALAGASPHDVVRGGPPMESVWRDFQAALRGASGWMEGEEPVPARPLLDPAEWPDGVDWVVEKDGGKAATDRRPCRYCDHQVLCGARACR